MLPRGLLALLSSRLRTLLSLLARGLLLCLIFLSGRVSQGRQIAFTDLDVVADVLHAADGLGNLLGLLLLILLLHRALQGDRALAGRDVDVGIGQLLLELLLDLLGQTPVGRGHLLLSLLLLAHRLLPAGLLLHLAVLSGDVAEGLVLAGDVQLTADILHATDILQSCL